MTQEELDAMMSDPEMVDEVDTDMEQKEVQQELNLAPKINKDTQVIKQLENVTKESEEKAAEVFDKLSDISDGVEDSSKLIELMEQKIKYFDDLFKKLNNRFPNVYAFKDGHEQIFDMQRGLEQLQKNLNNTNNNAFDAMDTMQFQDIHRQKIERVINVMRALARYMNDLLSGKIDDKDRVSSANHIDGDVTTENVVDNDDIEALLAQFGNN